MLDLDFDVGIILFDARLDRRGNAARHAVAPARCCRVVDRLLLVVRRHIDALRFKDRGELFKRDDKIDVAAHRAAARLQLLRRAGTDKDHARVGTVLLDGARRRDHGRECGRDFVDHVGELRLCKHTPRRAAGSEQERKFARHDLRRIMMRLGGSAHIRTVRDLVDFLEANFFERRLDLPERYIGSELPDDRGGDFGDDLIPLRDGADELEDLRFIGDRTERTGDHALSAADALRGIDGRPPEPVARDRLHAARLRAGTRPVRDRFVRTGGFAFPAFDTFSLVDDRLSRLFIDGDRSLGADRHAIARNTAAALIADLIDVILALVARRRNDLHERRFIVFIRNIARIQPARDMDGPVLRAQGHTHRKTDALGRNRALAIDALAVLRLFGRRYFIRDRLDVVIDVFRIIRDAGDFNKNLPAQLDDGCFQSSHRNFSFPR